ncbi:esterase-like activity of phytase family protein [Actinokineospora sp. NBRC 105648]|uniref:esterase-like activity of phytase family protein n=1 Tax=Actinokineospora sp. NBRC 105648 TaxID=3032206 RepID=UPI00255433C3|nr:esterase-like activity of phytase family protein [Actinokineospora sp. NBRC 105648]
MPRALAALCAAAVSAGALASPAAATPDHPRHPDHRGVRLIGERTVPNALPFQGTTVGGLSGIDRDPRTGGYVLISDDRSDRQPARFYTARIDVRPDGLGPVEFTSTHPFLRPDGKTYPPLATGDGTTVDPEDIRVDPWTGDYTWSQEGERRPNVLIDPSVRSAKRDGSFARELPLPANLKMTADRGPRQNLVLEGLTYAALGSLVVTSVEGPLLQDGPVADAEHGALSRIVVQTRSGHQLAQYAYPQEPVFARPVPPTGASSTGVTSILAVDPVDPTRFLVLERSFVQGVGNKVRVFEVDTRGATDVARRDLADPAGVRPVRKRLVADLADLGLSTVDNIEGMSWGPVLRGGERSLLLVSDDNFATTQVTQLVALGVRL